MLRTLIACSIAAIGMSAPMAAFAEQNANGSVIEHSGERGDLIVSRDGVVYWLSVGDDLFSADILRAKNPDSSIIRYNDCEFTLPEKEDVVLDDTFCELVVVETPTMAAIASEGGSLGGAIDVTSRAGAPLIVGGVVLSAGGLAATTNGGNGGTGSAASAAAGAPQAGADP